MVRYSFLVRLSHPLLHAGLIPALSLITLFARASTSAGIVRPICFAALRLMTNSNFVACCTGKSPGLAPFDPEKLYWLSKFATTAAAALRRSRYRRTARCPADRHGYGLP